jgi:hypothetical protein
MPSRFAHDARKVLQNLPVRMPRRLGLLVMKLNSEGGQLKKETTIWLHHTYGDPITGRTKRDVRKEIFAAELKEKEKEEEADESDVLMLDMPESPDRELEIEIVIENPTQHAMPRAIFDGVSEPELLVMSQTTNHQDVGWNAEVEKNHFVGTRWEIKGSHGGEVLGMPPPARI